MAGLSIAGCNGFGGNGQVELERTVQEQQEQIRTLQEKITDQASTIRGLQTQLTEQRGLRGDAFKMLVYPEKIELEPLSGGYDDDAPAGDDGIVLYIRPIDRDGHVVKAAGSLKVVLYDLANPSDRNVIQDYYFDEPTMRAAWFGRMWTHHFTIRCPWPPSGPPAHDEITVDAVFTDLLSGQLLRTQQLFKVTLPVK